jgi:hypothetical protein
MGAEMQNKMSAGVTRMIELVCNSQQNKAKRCASAVIHSGGRQIRLTCGMIFETLCVFAQISERKKRNLETAKIARKYLWIPSNVALDLIFSHSSLSLGSSLAAATATTKGTRAARSRLLYRQ